MSGFSIHRSAGQDLTGIWENDPESASYLAALLQQLKADEKLRSRLTQEDFGVRGLHTFNVDAYAALQRGGRNIWRLKLWNLEAQTIPYRIIYAYDQSRDSYYILGILERTFNYGTEHPRVRQIVADYDRLGLPTIPRY